MEEHLWVVEFRGGNLIPSAETSPEFPEEMIIVADTHFVVVEATHDEVESIISGYPYWKNIGHPADGKWIGSGGDATYIANGQILESAEEVLAALNIEFDPDLDDADDILSNLNRVF